MPHSEDTMDPASETKRLEANQSELRLHQQTLQTSVIVKRERVAALKEAVHECKVLLKAKDQEEEEERARPQPTPTIADQDVVMTEIIS